MRTSTPSAGPPTTGGAADQSMRALYDLHAEPLFRFLLCLTFGDRQAAEDLVQKTLRRAWRHRDQLTVDVAHLRPWLFTVARRIAMDTSRARRAWRASTPEVDTVSLSDPDDRIEGVTREDAMREALADLAPDHRAVLVEIYYRRRSVGEAADVLDIPVGTVKSHAYHALRALRWRIGESSDRS